MYCLMWPKKAPLLKPLSDKSGKKTICWTPQKDQVFQIMITILTVDVFMAQPNCNLPFNIHTNASDYLMGPKIIQQNKHVEWWSHNLTETQKTIIGCQEIFSQLSWFLKSSIPWLLVLNFSYILMTKIQHMSLLTAALSYARVHFWKSMVPPPSITMATKLS